MKKIITPLILLLVISFIYLSSAQVEEGKIIFGTEANKLLNSVCSVDGGIVQKDGAIWQCGSINVSGNATYHNLLNNLDWSVAGHIIDSDFNVGDGVMLNETANGTSKFSNAINFTETHSDIYFNHSLNISGGSFYGDYANLLFFDAINGFLHVNVMLLANAGFAIDGILFVEELQASGDISADTIGASDGYITNLGAASLTVEGATDLYDIVRVYTGIDNIGYLKMSADNTWLTFGASEDSGISYDGSDMIFDSQLVGSGNFNFENGNIDLNATDPIISLEDGNSVDAAGHTWKIKNLNRVLSFIRANSTDDLATAMVIEQSAGNVGIGNTTPSSKLHVEGDLNVTGTIYGLTTENPFDQSLNTTDNVTFSSVNVNGTGDNYFSGSVGINTSSPQNVLHTVGDIRFQDPADSDYLFFDFTSSGNTMRAYGNALLLESRSPGDDIIFKNNLTNELMRIDTDTRYVGINRTSPGALLDVGGGASFGRDQDNVQVNISPTTGSGHLRIGDEDWHAGTLDLFGNGASQDPLLRFYNPANDDSNVNIWQITTLAGDFALGSSANPNILLLNDSTGDFTIETNVGIGTDSPDSNTKLHIMGNDTLGASSGQLRITGEDTAKRFYFGLDTTDGFGWLQATDTGAGYQDLILNPNGANVGIGTTSPNYELEVNGDIYSDNFRWNSTNDSLAIGENTADLNDENLIIGKNAGETTNQTGLLAIGKEALNGVIGDYAYGIGDSAGQGANLTDSLAIGRNAYYQADDERGIAIGYNSGYQAESIYGTYIGFEAGRGLIGTGNIAIGESSGENLNGDRNNYFGYYSGYGTNGSFNSGIGYWALRQALANRTTASGYLSGYLSVGETNSFLGIYAGRNYTGSNSACVGPNACYDSTSTSSVGIGQGALEDNTGTSSNVGIGYLSLSQSDENNNIAIGTQAGDNAGGGEMALIGRSAGADSDAEDLISIGYYAGEGSEGLNNIFFGTNAGRNNTGNRVIGIGQDALRNNVDDYIFTVHPSGASDTPLLLGNTNTGLLGINRNDAPIYTLDVNGSANISNNLYYNQMYGEMWGHDVGEIAIDEDVYENITNLTEGYNNGFVFINNTLITPIDGTYKISGGWSFSGTANNEYHISLAVDGVQQDKCHAERVIGTGGDVGSASITCFLDLDATQNITAVIENVDSAGNPTIHDLNININWIGHPQS